MSRSTQGASCERATLLGALIIGIGVGASRGRARTRALLTTVIIGIGVSAFTGTACSTPDTAARVDPIGPDRTSFESVAKVLVRKCGTLDCHGETHRNFRLYGYGGLRLPSEGRRPDVGGGDLGADEVAANYDAVIGLEPEIMHLVVLDRGRAPERLTFVRKGRGAEDHKGKNAITTGDDADRCIVSWLASAVDVAACERVVPPTGPSDAGGAASPDGG